MTGFHPNAAERSAGCPHAWVQLGASRPAPLGAPSKEPPERAVHGALQFPGRPQRKTPDWVASMTESYCHSVLEARSSKARCHRARLCLQALRENPVIASSFRWLHAFLGLGQHHANLLLSSHGRFSGLRVTCSLLSPKGILATRVRVHPDPGWSHLGDLTSLHLQRLYFGTTFRGSGQTYNLGATIQTTIQRALKVTSCPPKPAF